MNFSVTQFFCDFIFYDFLIKKLKGTLGVYYTTISV